ncbi:MAG: thiamine phosphate synthase [Bryobacteraceae bacterium]|nr:thiamine phosphate synthase [Bryobacteraceae bacterium]
MVLPGFYPILDASSLERRSISMLVFTEAMLDGGARLLQYRRKTAFTREAFAEVEQVAALCRQAGATLVIDDRADIARVLACGLHVGQDDLPCAAARRVLGASLLLGFSTHNGAQMAAAASEPIDYAALGPIFGTSSKERPDAVVGLEGLRQIRRMSNHPVVAIGGITRERAAAVRLAGADSVAVIADLFPDDCGRTALRRRAEEWVRATTVL